MLIQSKISTRRGGVTKRYTQTERRESQQETTYLNYEGHAPVSSSHGRQAAMLQRAAASSNQRAPPLPPISAGYRSRKEACGRGTLRGPIKRSYRADSRAVFDCSGHLVDRAWRGLPPSPPTSYSVCLSASKWMVLASGRYIFAPRRQNLCPW